MYESKSSLLIGALAAAVALFISPTVVHAYGDSYASRQIQISHELDVVEAMDGASVRDEEEPMYQVAEYRDEGEAQENVVTAEEINEAFGNETRARMDVFQSADKETALPRDTDAPVLQQTYDSLGLKTKLTRKIYATFGAQWGLINGDVRYHIKSDDPVMVHGESELDWPLNNNLLGVVASLNLRRNADEEGVFDRARIQFSGFAWRLDKEAGTMKDSDWIEDDVAMLGGGWQHAGKDIFSDSDTKLDDIGIYDVSYTQNFWLMPNWAIGPWAGYRYQHFQFSSYNLDQVGYGPYELAGFNEKDTEGRRWIEYTVTSSMPYIGLSSELSWKDKLSLFVNFAYSDWVHMTDKDNHLARDRIARGHCDGKAYLYSIKGQWNLLPNLALGVGAMYEHIKAKGSQDYTIIEQGQEFSGTVGEDLTSRYWLFTSDVKYRF